MVVISDTNKLTNHHIVTNRDAMVNCNNAVIIDAYSAPKLENSIRRDIQQHPT